MYAFMYVILYGVLLDSVDTRLLSSCSLSTLSEKENDKDTPSSNILLWITPESPHGEPSAEADVTSFIPDSWTSPHAGPGEGRRGGENRNN